MRPRARDTRGWCAADQDGDGIAPRTTLKGAQPHDRRRGSLGQRQWQKASGSHLQARVENAFFWYKSVIGDGLRAGSPGGREVEASLACRILNRMTELGTPESSAINR
jgi:hypothetical protein